jgi:HAE1 family hydrophobic/amphiphilic exporter-1
MFGRATDGYITYSSFAIRRSAISLAVLAAIAVIGVAIGGKLPTSFLPEEDQGYLFVSMQLPQAASLQRTGDAAAKVEKIIQSTPGVDSVITVNGYSLLSSTQTTNNAVFFVSLKDWEERKSTSESAREIQQHLSAALMTQVKEGLAFVVSPPAIPGVGSSGGVTFVLQDRSGKGGDFLAENVDKFLAAVRKRPELASAITTYTPHVPQVYVNVDREKVLRQNVNLSDVYQTMQAFMGGYLVNYFNRFGRQWQVYIGADGEYRTKPNDIEQFYVTNPNGAMVPLTAVTNVSSTTGPDFTMRYNEYASAQIFASAAPGVSSGQAIKALEETFAQTMPSEMAFDYMGMSYQEQQAAKGVPPAAVFGLSTLFVFLILAALYESWTLPFSVLLGTPIAIFGAYATLALRHMENNVYAQIGLVMLIGLAAKNAILIVEFAKLEYENGKELVDAALTGARLRLRPILMTSFAFILGCVPLWTASGSGAVGRRMLGTAVIGGMTAASFIAIFMIPVTFVVVERLSHRFSRKSAVAPQISGEPEGEME